MKIQGGFGDTWCRQGGIGYPPLVVKISNRWYQVDDTEAHGGSICPKCSEARGIPYGYKPQTWGQPKPFGSTCYRSLIPRLMPKNRPQHIEPLPWKVFVALAEKQFGEPGIIT